MLRHILGLFFATILVANLSVVFAADPLVIAKTGDDASQVGEGLTFSEVSPPALTEDSERVAFYAKLSDGQKTLWFGDLNSDGYYVLHPAAYPGMAIFGLGSEDSDKVLDLIWGSDIFGFVWETTRTISQVVLDPKVGDLAFVAYLNNPENLGNLETAETALFIAYDSGVQLVAKEGKSGRTVKWGDFDVDIGIGFKEIQFINERLVFNSTVENLVEASNATGIGVYENGVLDFPVLSSEISPAYFADDRLPNNTLLWPDSTILKYKDYKKIFTIDRVRAVATNENGAIAHFVSGSIPDPIINNSRLLDLLRYRFPGYEDFWTVARTWDFPGEGAADRTFVSGFQEISMNKDNDLAVKVLLGEYTGEPKVDPVPSDAFPYGMPTFPLNKSAIILYEYPDLLFSTPYVIVQTGDEAVGYDGAGDNIIDRLESVQMAGSFVSYFAHFPGQDHGVLSLYRKNLEESIDSELLFYTGGPAHIEGLGTVSNIINANMGPNGDMVVRLLTGGVGRAVVHVSPPDEAGNSTYRLLARSFTNTTLDRIDNDCPPIQPDLAGLGFIPGGADLGPAIGPETGFGAWVSRDAAGWMLTPGIESDEYSVVFDIGINTDFGDAPIEAGDAFPGDPFGYPTTGIDAAFHNIAPFGLGPFISGEASGLPDRFAQGDNFDDGIQFPLPLPLRDLPEEIDITKSDLSLGIPLLFTNSTGVVSVDVLRPEDSPTLFLNGWIDFNSDGDWDDPGEQIITNYQPSGGIEEIEFQIPVLTETINSFARFRISDEQGNAPSGFGGNGEVEDYIVTLIDFDLSVFTPPVPEENPDPNDPDFRDPPDIPDIIKFATDFGDAPHAPLDPEPLHVPTGYPEGANIIIQGLSLGDIDSGNSSNSASLIQRYFAVDDDTPAPGGLDDEDGVVFYEETEELAFGSGGFITLQDVPLIGTSNSVEFGIIYSAPPDRHGWINAWMDFNRDGDWNDPGEQIVTDFLVPNGSNFPIPVPFTYAMPPNTELDGGYTFARFRISRFAGISAGVALPDGETEDYLVKVQVPMDFGDAPEVDEDDNYQTTLATNGARHLPVELGPVLGQKIDFELDGTPGVLALGDDEEDSELTDDEDGVLFSTDLIPGALARVSVFASQTAKLDAWVDYNGDGDWLDAGEQIFDSMDLVEDANSLTFTVPVDALLGPTYARFRISSNGNLEPYGLAQDGEVEDYLVEVGESFIRWEEVGPDGDRLYLRWSGRAILESSQDLADPWVVLESEKNEYWYSTTEGSAFFRLVEK